MPRDAIKLYEEPLLEGCAYPCNLTGIKETLRQLPEEDIDGIVSIGLVHGRRKDGANARYFYEPKPKIEIYSYPDSLSFRIGRNHGKQALIKYYEVEMSFGMAIEDRDGVWHAQWTPESLERFLLQHVLLHEIGHHVYRWQVLSFSNRQKPNSEASERYAEDYARRMRKGIIHCADATPIELGRNL